MADQNEKSPKAGATAKGEATSSEGKATKAEYTKAEQDGNEGLILTEIPVRGGKWRLQITTYLGKQVCTFRLWAYDYDGLVCTGKGLHIPLNRLDDLARAIHVAANHFKDQPS